MQHQLVICIVLLQVLGSISMPILPEPTTSELATAEPTTTENASELLATAVPTTESAASASSKPVVKLHDYFYTMFKLIKNDTHCDSMYNCQQISSHWCNANLIRPFRSSVPADDDQGQECVLKFSISLNDTVIGADLALHRLSNDTAYDVFIYEQVENDKEYLVASKEIGCETHKWEVFHINETAVKNWTIGQSRVQFKVNATDSNGTALSNAEVLQLFITSEDAYLNSTKAFQPIVTVFMDSKTTTTDVGFTYCQTNPNECNDDSETPTEESKDDSEETANDDIKTSVINDLFSRFKGTEKRDAHLDDELKPRTKRTPPSFHHSYVANILENRRRWQGEDCSELYNCLPVSTHHCLDNLTVQLSEMDRGGATPGLGCALDFSVNFSPGDREEGLNIALYRREDYELDPNYNYIVVMVFFRQMPNGLDVAAYNYFETLCEGWQEFSIDPVMDLLIHGHNTIELNLLVYKVQDERTFYQFTCEETLPIFVLNDQRPAEESTTQTPTEATEDLKANEDTYNQTNYDNEKDDQASGDLSSKMMNEREKTASIRTVEEYGPVVTFFVESVLPPFANIFHQKRSAVEDKAIDRNNKQSTCTLQHNTAPLAMKYPGENIIAPAEANFGSCTGHHDEQNTVSEESVCQPTSYERLDVIVQRGDQTFIETKHHAVIKHCG